MTNEFSNCEALCSLGIIFFLPTRSHWITLTDLELATEASLASFQMTEILLSLLQKCWA